MPNCAADECAYTDYPNALARAIMEQVRDQIRRESLFARLLKPDPRPFTVVVTNPVPRESFDRISQIRFGSVVVSDSELTEWTEAR